jgi:hypothetical protein
VHRNVLVATLLVALAIATVSCSRPSPPAGTPPAVQSSQALNTQQPDANTPGDIPDNQAFVAFTAQDHSFTVDVPEGWARTNSGDGATFSDTFNSMAITSHTGTAAPTPEGARLTELAEIAVADPSVSNGDVSTVTRPAGQTVLLTYRQESAVNPVTGKSTALAVERYEFFRNGQTVALTLAGPMGADNVDPWRHITDSFRWAP